ncbi:hypothetical protein H0H92_004874 [Tricholoma furcatifolium]|nr:hypothetical protein H0H92_004874 [Tricholoma furcatifolium]
MAHPRRSARLGLTVSTCTPPPADDSPRALRAAKRRRLSGPPPALPLGSIAMPGSAASPIRAKRSSTPPRSPLSSPPLSPVKPKKENVIQVPLRRSPRHAKPRVSPRRAHLPPPVLPPLPAKRKRSPKKPKVEVEVVESTPSPIQLDPVEPSPPPPAPPAPPPPPAPDYQYAFEPQPYHHNEYHFQPPRRERDSLKLWKTACRIRVDTLQVPCLLPRLQKRYTPLTIRDLVAQEADDYFLRHGYPKPLSAVTVAKMSSDEEDWSEYESELSDDDDDEEDDDDDPRPPKKLRPAEDDDEDDEDADGDVDPEAYAHDPSFNAELSSAIHDGRRTLRAPQAKPRGGVGAHLGAFYVPLDNPKDTPPHMSPSPPPSPPPQPQPPRTYQYPYQYPYPYTYHDPTLPVPPPRLSTIPALNLKNR